VVHKPSTVNNNYYGADVAGPVFKRIAQKILQMFLRQTKLKNIDRKVPKQEKNYNNYFAELQKPQQSILMLKGCQEWMRLLY
jgi:cell division protein FtsI (penicillin-binding protein 3)